MAQDTKEGEGEEEQEEEELRRRLCDMKL